MKVLKDRESRCAIVITEAPDKVAMVRLNSDGTVILDLHPTVWGEKPDTGEMVYDPDKIRKEHLKWNFDEMWKPVMVKGGGLYSVQEAARKLLRGINGKVAPDFGNGAIEALMTCLPHGDVHLFTEESGFIGRFSATEDAVLVARARHERGIHFESPADLKALPGQDFKIVQSILDASRKWPDNPGAKLYKEIFEMSKAKQTSELPKKMKKAEASKRRADGPVAKARELFAKMKTEVVSDSAAVIAACLKAGINKGTASVQLGKWRKENNIVAKRAVKVKKTKKTDAKKAETKKPEAGAAAVKPKTKKKSKPAIPSTPAAEAEADKATVEQGDSSDAAPPKAVDAAPAQVAA